MSWTLNVEEAVKAAVEASERTKNQAEGDDPQEPKMVREDDPEAPDRWSRTANRQIRREAERLKGDENPRRSRCRRRFHRIRKIKRGLKART